MPSLGELSGSRLGTSLRDLVEGFRLPSMNINEALAALDARRRAGAMNVRSLLTDPIETLQRLGTRVGQDFTQQSRTMLDAAANRRSAIPQLREEATEKLLSGLLGAAGIVSPAKAVELGYKVSLPRSEEFISAVANTPKAAITENGLLMNVQRRQSADQALEPSVRGGVFYLPEGDKGMRHYTGKTGYGGGEKIAGQTLVQNPLFVKGATGGKAPESAYDQVAGKGAYQAMRSDALSALGWGRADPEKVEQFLGKYAPELVGHADYIIANSRKGNTLPYALQEAAVASAVRAAGHDSILGFSKRRTGEQFLSELFDLRESHYPDAFGTSRTWPVGVLHNK